MSSKPDILRVLIREKEHPNPLETNRCQEAREDYGRHRAGQSRGNTRQVLGEA